MWGAPQYQCGVSPFKMSITKEKKIMVYKFRSLGEPTQELMIRDVDGDEVKDYFLRTTRCPAIILEPEFIHNKSVITNKRDVTSIMIASGLARALTLCL